MTNLEHVTAHALVLLASLGVAGAAQAGAAQAGVAQAETPPSTSPPYSLPWQLRPVTTGNVLRVDSAVAAFKDDNGNLDLALTTVLTGSYRLTRHWAPVLRLGFVGNDAPGAAHDGTSFANPVIGVTYARQVGSYNLALYGATAIPVGAVGGDTPNARAVKTHAAAATARPADDAMFAVDYLTAIAGADVAYVDHHFTLQAELTLQQSVRVRGADSPVATDQFRTQAAVGLNLGYFIGSHFSFGIDVRYERWLSHPTVREPATGAQVPFPDSKMDTLTVAAGPRVHVRLGQYTWLRPGLSFMRGFDVRGFGAPLLNAQTTAIALDVPLTF